MIFQILAFACFAITTINADANADPYYYYTSSYNPYHLNPGYGFAGYPYYAGGYPSYTGYASYPYYGYSHSFPINTIQGRENSEIDPAFIPTIPTRYTGAKVNEEIKVDEPKTVTPTLNKIQVEEETVDEGKFDDEFTNPWASYGAYGYGAYGYGGYGSGAYGYANSYPSYLYATNPYAYAFHY